MDIELHDPTHLREAATHEAGHAIVASALGFNVKSISVVPDGKSLGRTVIHLGMHPRPVHVAAVCLAGLAAQMQAEPQQHDALLTACLPDVCQAVALCLGLGSGFSTAYFTAVDLLARHEQAARRLGSRLAERQVLDRGDLTAVLGGRNLPAASGETVVVNLGLPPRFERFAAKRNRMNRSEPTDASAKSHLWFAEVPARLHAEEAAILLGFRTDEMYLLREFGLEPLGSPAPNAPKYYWACDVLEFGSDRDKLDRATRAIYEQHRGKNVKHSAQR